MPRPSSFEVERAGYRIEVSGDGLWVTLARPGGAPWVRLRPHAAFDCVEGVDETLAVSPPREVDGGVVVERRSTLWESAAVSIRCGDTQVELRATVTGRGRLTDVNLLALRSLVPGTPAVLLPSAVPAPRLFCANPAHATGVRPATEPAVIGVTGGGEPGRHHWFFTPSPLYLAWAEDDEREWLDLGLVAPVERLTFIEAAYAPRDLGFHLRLEYEGHTVVDGAFEAPALLLTPGVADPVSGLRRHRDDLVRLGAAPPVAERKRPAWWTKPIFCGWGAQSHLAEASGRPAADFATQASYDAFLERLDAEGVKPGTVVLDDKWQIAYGTNEPDPAKWPDLRDWIGARHAQDQRVLLWWKAWDPEGLPADLCVLTPDGAPVAVDPTNPAARDALAAQIARLLGPDELDADGLKVDFTSRTPSGRALRLAGSEWGIALLHELLSVVYGAAKSAKPDALVITHTPHPAFADVTDMIRLNDMIGGHASVVPQMRFRAEVARAACPELLVDTDDWRVPSLAAWREYQEVKPELGVPSLYYATHVDATGEAFERSDYELLRSVWDRSTRG